MQRILARLDRPAAEVIGQRDALRGLSPEAFVDERFGVPTVRDIFAELEKPGRDPRGDFVTASFREGIEKVSDLQPGMVLEGVVTNVANFGAFVDIGVHQDGLAVVSVLLDRRTDGGPVNTELEKIREVLPLIQVRHPHQVF